MSMDFKTVQPGVVMRAYISDMMDPREDEWPVAWVIVKVNPEHWMTTLRLDHLIDILKSGRGDIPLNGIRHSWDDTSLVLDLGPATVRAAPTEWRALIRRLLDHAGTTRELYETPRGRGWPGPQTYLSASEVSVDGSDLMWGFRPDPGPVVCDLAAAGGFDPLELWICSAETGSGSPWRRRCPLHRWANSYTGGGTRANWLQP
jgi:hypothetical protein